MHYLMCVLECTHNGICTNLIFPVLQLLYEQTVFANAVLLDHICQLLGLGDKVDASSREDLVTDPIVLLVLC